MLRCVCAFNLLIPAESAAGADTILVRSKRSYSEMLVHLSAGPSPSPSDAPVLYSAPPSPAGLFSFLSRRYAKPMTDRQQAPDDLTRLRPPTVSEAEKPLRRQVAMAYRTAREARLLHHAALAAAQAVYFRAHPQARADRPQASARGRKWHRAGADAVRLEFSILI
jgi:hypothetical protein